MNRPHSKYCTPKVRRTAASLGSIALLSSGVATIATPANAATFPNIPLPVEESIQPLKDLNTPSILSPSVVLGDAPKPLPLYEGNPVDSGLEIGAVGMADHCPQHEPT